MEEELDVTIDAENVSAANMTIEPQFWRKIEDLMLELWVDCAAEFDVEYEIKEFDGKKRAVPVNEMEARLRNFGSGTQGIPAEYWFDKAKKLWESKVNTVRF